ncbi:hypothetical protein KKG48_02975 [Patescibacteria group bacterium]|nr:hypothetical protein [Patescibacteria group bacterium]MCG2694633.1 hypothetical protein [Candidatus Parcubacteria bacterium]
MSQITSPTVSPYISRIFNVLVDESKEIEELVSEKTFDWSRHESEVMYTKIFTYRCFSSFGIVSKNFPRPEDGIITSKEIVLFCFDKTMTSEDVIVEMEKVDYRPATVFELLGLGIVQKSGHLGKFVKVVSLGSVCGISSERRVAVLVGDEDGRCISLDWFDLHPWSNNNCYFAGLRK